jgi:iron-sulfur cluster assembly protein
MIYISNKAKKKLIEFINKDGLKTEKIFVRISIKNGGCAGLTYDMSFDSVKNENDYLFENNNMKILVNSNDLIYLDEITIEYADGLKGKGFYFINPNAQQTCKCGSSFSPK